MASAEASVRNTPLNVEHPAQAGVFTLLKLMNYTFTVCTLLYIYIEASDKHIADDSDSSLEYIE